MSIVMRIYIGMAAMVILIVGVGGFATFQTNGLASTFVDYRKTAKTSLLAAEVAEQLGEARIASLKFRAKKNKEYIDTLSESVAEISKYEAEMFTMLEGFPEQNSINEIHDLLVEYEAAMLRAAKLQDDRDVYVETTSAVGLKARKQLSEIIESALKDGDPQASSVAGVAISNMLLGRLYLERFLVSNDASDSARSTKEIEAARVGLENLLTELQNPRRRELAQATIADLDVFDEAAAAVAEVIIERNAQYVQMDKIGPEVLGLMQQVVDGIVERQNTLGPAGAKRAQLSILIVGIIVLAGAVIGSVMAFAIGRVIASKLTTITNGMTELAEGNLDVVIEPSADKHEVGKMTNAMVVFLNNARKARDLDIEVKETEKREREREAAEKAREIELEKERSARVEREREAELERMRVLEDFQRNMERVLGEAAAGNFSNRMTTDIKDESLSELATVINELLESTETNISNVVDSIGQLAQGNLGVRIEGERQGAFLRLKDDFNASLETLSASMARIMQSGQTVSLTSSDLEAASLSMARRAEDSAASVEETSAAVEQITASIRQVVNNAKVADEATRRVRESAAENRKVSDETEASIKAMTDASAQINRVVKVIEDIAFQINLLALNAGVEAARAGDAGRGFAVVASEVRALALRSQEAVQEISVVIDQNNQSVELGVKQVELSRQALEGIISEIEVASGQISDIAMAVEQQSLGIENVNTSVRAIDSTSQVNAASLEEMTASSVALSSEAKVLADALDQFHGVAKDQPEKEKVVSLPKAAPKISQEPPKKVAAAGGGSAAPEINNGGWDDF